MADLGAVARYQRKPGPGNGCKRGSHAWCQTFLAGVSTLQCLFFCRNHDTSRLTACFATRLFRECPAPSQAPPRRMVAFFMQFIPVTCSSALERNLALLGLCVAW